VRPKKIKKNITKIILQERITCFCHVKNTTVKNIIFSSSCSIYGNIKGSVNERKKPNPQGYYALTKYKGEELIKKYALKFNYNFGILRYFNVAGASPSGRIGEIETSHGHLIKNIAIQSMNKKPKLNIYGNNYNTKDGTCVRDYIHVTDLADIHIKGIKYLKVNKKSFILNCGYGKGYSVLQIANKFKKIKKNTQINFMKRRSGDIAQVFSDTKKFKKLLKWKPRYNDINKIIKSAINWEVKLKIYRKKI
jgi:UDP-glucose 4-epimerase